MRPGVQDAIQRVGAPRRLLETATAVFALSACRPARAPRDHFPAADTTQRVAPLSPNPQTQNSIVDYEQLCEQLGEEGLAALIESGQAGVFLTHQCQKAVFFPIKETTQHVPNDEELAEIEQRYNSACVALAQRVTDMADRGGKDVQDLAADLGLDFELVFDESESSS